MTSASSSGSTVRYFGEGQYVTQDDATAGNQNNNSSYREVSASGGGTAWTFGYIGSTQRTLQAIRAWPLADPGATLVNVQMPSGGDTGGNTGFCHDLSEQSRRQRAPFGWLVNDGAPRRERGRNLPRR